MRSTREKKKPKKDKVKPAASSSDSGYSSGKKK
jgi:hypothetical protein